MNKERYQEIVTKAEQDVTSLKALSDEELCEYENECLVDARAEIERRDNLRTLKGLVNRRDKIMTMQEQISALKLVYGDDVALEMYLNIIAGDETDETAKLYNEARVESKRLVDSGEFPVEYYVVQFTHTGSLVESADIEAVEVGRIPDWKLGPGNRAYDLYYKLRDYTVRGPFSTLGAAEAVRAALESITGWDWR